MGTVPFTMRLEAGLKRALETEAQLEERSASQLATRAIKKMLEAKAARRKIIQEAVAEADKGEFISDEKMTAWFTSLGTDAELPEPESDVFSNTQTQ